MNRNHQHTLFTTRGAVALAALALGILFVSVGSLLPLPAVAAKLLFDYGKGSLFPYPFTIQNLMWCIFFVGLGELFHRSRQSARHLEALAAGYLPEQDDIVLTRADMGAIYRTVKSSRNDLAELIKSLVLRFQAGRSVEQTHEMLNSQLELRQYCLEIDYNMVRYLSWLIPTLGFIGTVVGIARTLTYAGATDPTTDHFLADITARLGVAFDTTLLALVMSALLVFGMHIIQGREEKAIVENGQYCLDHLLTRLYVE